MKLTRIFFYSSLFALSSSLLCAQEHLVPLRTNPALVRYVQAAKRTHTPVWRLLSDSIMATLPFLDDFSRPGPYPYDSLWMDNAAFINNTYPICPPTLGVATLDGVNGQGQPYDPSCPIGGSEPADSLTSRPIDLTPYQPSDSLYLSFFYQAGGRGFAPQTSDSLLLQFKTNSVPWTTVWYHLGYTPGPTDTSFHSVMIKFLDNIHTISYSDTGADAPSGTFNPFSPNFQFRFKNYACTSANSDQWNIDEVYLNLNRTYNDTAGFSSDVSFVYESPSLLANYQYMPWEQFTDNDIRDTMYIQERSNGSTAPINMRYHDSIPAVGAAYPVFTVYDAGNANIQPFYDSGYNDVVSETHIPIKSQFTYTPLTGPADITFIHLLSTTQDWIKWNDTLRFDQIFSDYYAYDDGTAEAAYFVNGTTPLQLAYQITLNKPDTLRGLQISFNYFVANPTNSNFRLAVWDNSGPQGSPGVLRFEDDSIYTPQVSDSLNGFVFYPFHFDKDSAIPAGTPFYVGLIQTYGDSINIGYDLNTNHQTQLYYNANIYPAEWNTGWNTGTYSGSLMMRPVFGNKNAHAPMPTEIPDIKSSSESLTIYPNPANNRVNLSASMPANSILKIYTADGRECLNNNNFSGSLINTSLLAEGFYIVEITPPGSQTYYQKLLIQR